MCYSSVVLCLMNYIFELDYYSIEESWNFWILGFYGYMEIIDIVFLNGE